MKKILVVFLFLYGCNGKDAAPISTPTNTPIETEKSAVSELELVMTTYRKAWIDGANAAIHACNNNESFGETRGNELMKKDSLAFRQILESINQRELK